MKDFIEYFFEHFFNLLSEQEICALKGAFVFELNDDTNILLDELKENSKRLAISMTHSKFLCSSDEKLKEKPVNYNFICQLEYKFCYVFKVKNIKFYTFTDESRKLYVYVKLESSKTYTLHHLKQFAIKKILELGKRLDLKALTSLKKCREPDFSSMKIDPHGSDTDGSDTDSTDADIRDAESTDAVSTDAVSTDADSTDNYIKYYAEDIDFNSQQHIKIAVIIGITIKEYEEKKKIYTICGDNKKPGNEIFINKEYLQTIVEKYNIEYITEKYLQKIEEKHEKIEEKHDISGKIISGGKSNNYSKKIIKNTKKSSRPRTSSATRRRGRGRKKHRARSRPSKNRRP